MVNPKLLDYVKRQLSQGMTREQIQGALLAQGWQAKEISEAFGFSVPPSQQQAAGSYVPPVYQSPVMRASNGPGKIVPIIIAVLGGLILIGGGAFAYFFYFSNSPEKIIKKSLASMIKVKSFEFAGETRMAIASDKSADTSSSISLFPLKENYNVSYQYSGALDMMDKNNPKGNLTFNVETDALPTMDLSVGAELRVVDKVAYIKLSSLPNLGFIDLSAVSNQWVRLDPADMEKELGATGLKERLEAAQTKQNLSPEQEEKIVAAMIRSKMLKIKKLADEKIEGVDCYHFQIITDKEELKKLYFEILNIINPETATDEMIAGFNEAFKAIGSIESEIFIGKKDLLFYKFTSAIKMVKTDKSAAAGEIVSSLLFKNFNQPVQIAAPEQYKTLEEILNSLFRGFNMFGSAGAMPSNNLMGLPGYNAISSGQPGQTVDPDADADQDGLPDQLETIYGTNQNNPDTDGDGFKDGDEVKSGYNPNGAGKLNVGNPSGMVN